MANFFFQKHRVFSAFLLTFLIGSVVYASPKNGSSTRIKRDGAGEKTKDSGYHNQVRSPSREYWDEYYLLVPEEPKTDEEWNRRRFEAAQLPKILSVLKAGNFAKAHQLLKELAQTMPIDTKSRTCYDRLASMCQDRIDTEYWYRYDIKDLRHTQDVARAAAQQASKATTSSPTTQAVHGLRKETWLLLNAGEQSK